MFKITLRNSIGGEIDVRIVDREDKIRAAVREIISGLAFMSPGDTLSVEEIE